MGKKPAHPNITTAPSIGVGGYCLTKDPWFVSALGEKHGASIALPRCGREVNDKMPRYCANEIMSFFAGQGKSASDVKVAILGYSFKSNSGDVRFTPMEAFISHMLDEGVGNISVFDSTISDVAINDSRVRRVDRWEVCVDEADCVVFGAAHDDLCQIQISEFPKRMADDGLLYDGRRFLSRTQILELKKNGIAYQGVGRSYT